MVVQALDELAPVTSDHSYNPHIYCVNLHPLVRDDTKQLPRKYPQNYLESLSEGVLVSEHYLIGIRRGCHRGLKVQMFSYLKEVMSLVLPPCQDSS